MYITCKEGAQILKLKCVVYRSANDFIQRAVKARSFSVVGECIIIIVSDDDTVYG